ncbi:MAG TPA: GNAT family N-acetyltransferase [Methanoregulaceae archaeon]|nr:GNAT family N-acetyltransferase [Methanoregulaceae archaeon]HPD74516.1 GNAT family N-acetyltransferase [Methanoregulaceae archaeon]
MELKIFQDSDKESWDSFVRESGYGTFFHTWDWLKIMERYSFKYLFRKKTPSKLHTVAVIDKSGIVGICPLFSYDAPFVRIVASPAFAVENHYLGPVLRTSPGLLPENQQLLTLDFIKEIDDYLRKTFQPQYILFHTSPGFADMRPFVWSGYEVEPRYTYKMDLTIGKDGLWKAFPRGLKRMVLKAEKAGIVVREGSEEDLRHIFALLRNRDRIYQDFDFLHDLYESFHPKNFRVFIAYHGDERLSGITLVTYKDTAYFWVGSPKYEYQGFSPNALVVWYAIQWAIESGYSCFEILGADDYSLFPFKRKFNASLSMYFTARWLTPFKRVTRSVYGLIRSKKDPAQEN